MRGASSYQLKEEYHFINDRPAGRGRGFESLCLEKYAFDMHAKTRPPQRDRSLYAILTTIKFISLEQGFIQGLKGPTKI